MSIRICSVFAIIGFALTIGIRLVSTTFPDILSSKEDAEIILIALLAGHSLLTICFWRMRNNLKSAGKTQLSIAASIAMAGEILAIFVQLVSLLRIKEILFVDQPVIMARVEAIGIMISVLTLWCFFLILMRRPSPAIPGSSGAFRGISFFLLVQITTVALHFVNWLPMARGRNLMATIVMCLAVFAFLAIIRVFFMIMIRPNNLLSAT